MPATAARRADANAAAPPEVSTVDAAAGIVADIEDRLVAAQTAAEQIRAARAPLAFDASRGDADAASRLADLTRASAENAQQVSDLTVALSEAKQRLADAEAAAHVAADEQVLAHARELAARFIAQSERIDQALAEIVDAHAVRENLAVAILGTRLLHPAWHHALGDLSRITYALSYWGAAPILAPNQPVASGKVLGITSLADADAATLRGLSLENRTARSNF